MTLIALPRLNHTRLNENKLNINSGSDISDNRIDEKIANLSNNIKKMSFGVGFLIFKARLAFT